MEGLVVQHAPPLMLSATQQAFRCFSVFTAAWHQTIMVRRFPGVENICILHSRRVGFCFSSFWNMAYLKTSKASHGTGVLYPSIAIFLVFLPMEQTGIWPIEDGFLEDFYIVLIERTYLIA
jgi:hypothetical protein